jgi:hypothetical protein
MRGLILTIHEEEDGQELAGEYDTLPGSTWIIIAGHHWQGASHVLLASFLILEWPIVEKPVIGHPRHLLLQWMCLMTE